MASRFLPAGLAAALASGLGAEEPWLPPSLPARGSGSAVEPDLAAFWEAGAGLRELRGGARGFGGFTAIDARGSARISPFLDAGFSARVERAWGAGTALGPAGTILALREARFSARPAPGWTVDAGRLLAREGVALGFNPTDIFRLDAFAPPLPILPQRSGTSRLGVLGARVEYLDQGRGASLVLAPAWPFETGDPDAPGFPFGATNRMGRAFLKVMPGSVSGIYVNLACAASEGGGRMAGFNLNRDLGDSLVLYAEAAGARRTAAEAGDGRWFGQAAVGATFSTRRKQVVTLEYRHNGAASIAAEGVSPWARWQEPDARDSFMLHGTWEGFLKDSIALAGTWRSGAEGGSALLEATLRLRRSSIALALGTNAPGPLAQRSLDLSAILRIHFK